ncbi:hypothetical protein V1515DRAFT_583934 [Lipomyces mesembrius]
MSSDCITRSANLSRDDFTPSVQSLMANWINGHADMTREKAAVDIIRLFLAKHGTNEGPVTFRDFFPPSWKAGKTPVPVNLESPGGMQLRGTVPQIRAYDQMVVRLKADWSATAVDMASAIFAAAQNKVVVTREELLRLNQQSPETYHLLKEAVALYKANFNRLLDPVAGRRDPKFPEVAARYGDQIRSLAEEQQEAAMRVRELSRRMERLLAAQDDGLSKLDPWYKLKHVTAAAVGLDTRQKKRRRNYCLIFNA